MKNFLNRIMMIATALAVAFVVYSCKGKLVDAEAKSLADSPVQTVDDMIVVHSENGKLQMRMEATLMERYDTDTLSYELFPKGFSVYAYTDEGLLETHIKSNQAKHLKYDDGRESWEAYGDVVVRNLIKKEVMETDTLYWNQKEEKIFTHCYVKLHSPSGFMQGYGMESDQRARNSIIFRPFDSYGLITQEDSTKISVDSINFIGPIIKK